MKGYNRGSIRIAKKNMNVIPLRVGILSGINILFNLLFHIYISYALSIFKKRRITEVKKLDIHFYLGSESNINKFWRVKVMMINKKI
jgi:hypothetical protein